MDQGRAAGCGRRRGAVLAGAQQSDAPTSTRTQPPRAVVLASDRRNVIAPDFVHKLRKAAWTYRSFLDRRRAMRPAEEYREPTDAEWTEFQQHFHTRKIELGDCGRPYGTPCKHEHACVRCPMLRVDPRLRGRLTDIQNLNDRVTEAKTSGWLGEVEGLQISLNAAKTKLRRLDRMPSTERSRLTNLGIPAILGS